MALLSFSHFSVEAQDITPCTRLGISVSFLHMPRKGKVSGKEILGITQQVGRNLVLAWGKRHFLHLWKCIPKKALWWWKVPGAGNQGRLDLGLSSNMELPSGLGETHWVTTLHPEIQCTYDSSYQHSLLLCSRQIVPLLSAQISLFSGFFLVLQKKWTDMTHMDHF